MDLIDGDQIQNKNTGAVHIVRQGKYAYCGWKFYKGIVRQVDPDKTSVTCGKCLNERFGGDDPFGIEDYFVDEDAPDGAYFGMLWEQGWMP
jgi:hypothetical protein